VKSLLAQLRTHFEAALVAAFGEAGRGVDPLIKAAGDPKFGDYQSNVAMSLAKKLGQKPRDVAQKIVDALLAAPISAGFAEMCDTPEIAGPGFINLRLKTSFVQRTLAIVPPAPETGRSGAAVLADPTLPTSLAFDRLGIEPVTDADRQMVVIDYSSPNVAKQMHVGHLRSTIIGDTLARVVECEGHRAIRQNHIGDWGTQFGIILEELYARGILPRGATSLSEEDWARLPKDPEELEVIYRSGNAKMTDPGFADRARQAVTRLQGGAEAENRAWRAVAVESMRGVYRLYDRLGVMLQPAHTCGESFYNPLLPGVVEELRAALAPNRQSSSHAVSGLSAVCREDRGAVCVFLEKPDGAPAFKGPQGDPQPMLIQKSDGAFLYTTTDLAGLAYRINDFIKQPIRFQTASLRQALRGVNPELGDCGGLGADRILYVVGAPQKLHFEMLFATARALGWTRPGNRTTEVELQHVPFGSVLGEDRKMLRTRSGESVKLKDLLDEAVARAEKLVRDTEADPDKRRGFSDEEIKNIAETVGIGAVKYADLCQNRNTDYVFSWDKMLALQGNTAPYMLYAYARIRSIYRKGAEQSALSSQQPAGQAGQAAITLGEPAERALGMAILRLPETIDAVADALLPNILCEYLYDLAGRFMTFYESCPVLQAPDDVTRASRLVLCDLTARALKLGLALLGIRTLERM